MKKYHFTLFFTMILMMSSCNDKPLESNVSGKYSVLEAVMESHQTKSFLYYDDYVFWSSGDAITVFSNMGDVQKYTLSSGAGTDCGEFSGSIQGIPEYAIYPSVAAKSKEGSKLLYTLPSEQKYVENSFDGDANVAIASITDGKMKFKNACGLLNLKFSGDFEVTKIVLNGDTDLCGTFSVDTQSENLEAECLFGGGHQITMTFAEPVLLSPDTFRQFYFVVPTGAFGKNGFSVDIYTLDGFIAAKIKAPSITNVIQRSVICSMPEYEARLLPLGYSRLRYASSGGYAAINTGVAGNADFDAINVKYRYIAYKQYSGIFGNYASEDANVVRLIQQNSNNGNAYLNFNWIASSSEKCSDLGVSGKDYDLKIRKSVMSVNGTPVEISAHSGGSTNRNPIQLFCSGASNGGGQCRIYYFSIQKGDTFLYYGIPCRRDGIVGMFNLVNGTFTCDGTNLDGASFSGQ